MEHGTPSVMKKCGLCGRENDEGAARCVECGSEFAASPSRGKPVSPRDWTWLEWLKFVLTCAGTVLCVGLLYLLSLGPVERYCFNVTSRTTTTTVNEHDTAYTIVLTVRVPRWAAIFYRPALMVRNSADPAGLYTRYLDWWTRGRRSR